MKTWWSISFGVLCGLLAAGVILVTTGSPRGQPVELLAPPTPAPLVVHVSGAVVQPGVYSLPHDYRVHQALEAAGGLAPDADTSSLNFAAFLQDGARLWIPHKAKQEEQATLNPKTQDPVPLGEDQTDENPSIQSGLININTATQSELESLPGIGPVMAERIIAYRQENGPFTRIEDIEKVAGIGPTTLEKIKVLISISASP